MGIEMYGDDELIEALANRGIDARPIDEYSDTELNNELTRRRNEAMKRYSDLMAQGLV